MATGGGIHILPQWPEVARESQTDLYVCVTASHSETFWKSSKSNLIEMTVKTLNMIFHSKKTQPIATIPLSFTPYFPPGATAWETLNIPYLCCFTKIEDVHITTLKAEKQSQVAPYRRAPDWWTKEASQPQYG